ncbi:MAG: hypothetical protein LUC21_05635, partial [Oscillospiraceae bacterium]|nr:hypothetical protein [Oscillospiraceae bacterium]
TRSFFSFISVSVAAPILSAGDVNGCVLFGAERETAASHGGELEQKLAQMVAGFLGRQMEN